ncbi:MAG: hypothetical protein ACKVUS_07440 [Saprospiraceae bacterium]
MSEKPLSIKRFEDIAVVRERGVQPASSLSIERFEAIAPWQACQQDLLKRLGITKPSAVEQDFFHCGLAVFGDAAEVLAVCVVYDNPALFFEGKPAGCFGNFDSLNHPEAAKRLLSAASETAADLGKPMLIGPMNASTWGEYRVAVNAFDYTYLLDVQHPHYYADLLRQAGLQPIGRYVTHLDTDLLYNQDRLMRARKLLSPLHLTFRNIDLENYDLELDKIYAFCMASFASNYLFTPIEKGNFKSKYLPLKAFLRPEYIVLCEDELRALRGLIFAVPNYSDAQQKGMVIKTIAKSPSPKFAGLATILGAMLYDKMKADGFQYALHAFMEEHNGSVNLSHYFSGNVVKRYELFGVGI